MGVKFKPSGGKINEQMKKRKERKKKKKMNYWKSQKLKIKAIKMEAKEKVGQMEMVCVRTDGHSMLYTLSERAKRMKTEKCSDMF